LIIQTEGDQVLKVRGNADHPVTHGYCCPKGRSLPAFHHHPNRLDAPELRGRVVSWEELISDLVDGIKSIVGEVGPDAIAVYNGTWSWMDSLGRTRTDRVFRHLGTKSWYSATTVDAIARSTIAELLTGLGGIIPTLDMDNPGFTILLGTNPVVSHGHAGAMADPITTLRRIARDHGLWVIDPRLSESARLATRHLVIRPGGDPALLAYAVRALLGSGADEEYLVAHAIGVEDLRVAVEPWTLEKTSERTGLVPSDLEDLVGAIRDAGRVSVVTGTGCTMAAEANVSEWLAWTIQIITGSFEHPGGTWFNPGALRRLDQAEHHPTDGTPAPGPPSRPDLPGRFGERPCAGLADEIESGNIRALFVIGGNPLTSLPNTTQLREAFGKLEILAVADVIRADTVAYATHVLPIAGQLEREDVTWFSDLFPPVMTAQRTAAVIPPGAQRRTLFDVMQDVGEQLGLPRDPDPMAPYVRRLPALAEPGVIVADPPRVKGWVHEKVLPDGRWRVAPPVLVSQLKELEDWTAGDLVGIPRRTSRRMNSALRDLGRGMEDSELWVNTEDAAAAGIEPDSLITVTNAIGSFSATVRVTDEIVRGAVSIPHGLSPQNVSLITDGSRGTTDPLTGMPVQSGIPISISSGPSAPSGPDAPTSSDSPDQ
jgi:anaerobic selenocysteine-containing dehydrogenase